MNDGDDGRDGELPPSEIELMMEHVDRKLGASGMKRAKYPPRAVAYRERTRDELVRDVNEAHRKLRWEKLKSRILAGLVTASLTSSMLALAKAAVLARLVGR